MVTEARARLHLLAGAALFSTGGAAVKACDLPALEIAGLRSLIAALVLLAAFPSARRIGARSLAIGAAYATTLVLFVAANKQTTSANAILLQSTAPLYLVVLGPWLLREPVDRRQLALFAAVAAGMLLCLADRPPPAATAPAPVRGNLLAVASGLTWAATLIGLRWSSRAPVPGKAAAAAEDALGAVAAGNLIASVAALGLAAAGGALAAPTAVEWGLLGWLGGFQIGLAYVCVTAGLRRVGAFEASLLLLAEPVLNPVWSWLAHGERPGALTLAAGALILGGTALAAARGRA